MTCDNPKSHQKDFVYWWLKLLYTLNIHVKLLLFYLETMS